jgi:hypothetical protein
MTSTEEIVLGVLLLVFVSCGLVMCVGCISALLKKIYDKYVLNLPDVYELPPTIFQNLEGRYAKANVSVIPPVTVEPTIVDLSMEDDGSEDNVVAIEVRLL